MQATVSFLAKGKVCYGKNKTSRVSSVDIRTEDQIANIRQHVADILVLATGSKSMPMARIISNIEQKDCEISFFRNVAFQAQ